MKLPRTAMPAGSLHLHLKLPVLYSATSSRLLFQLLCLLGLVAYVLLFFLHVCRCVLSCVWAHVGVHVCGHIVGVHVPVCGGLRMTSSPAFRLLSEEECQNLSAEPRG